MSHDIIILSFCNIVKGQANCIVTWIWKITTKHPLIVSQLFAQYFKNNLPDQQMCMWFL